MLDKYMQLNTFAITLFFTLSASLVAQCCSIKITGSQYTDVFGNATQICSGAQMALTFKSLLVCNMIYSCTTYYQITSICNKQSNEPSFFPIKLNKMTLCIKYLAVVLIRKGSTIYAPPFAWIWVYSYTVVLNHLDPWDLMPTICVCRSGVTWRMLN